MRGCTAHAFLPNPGDPGTTGPRIPELRQGQEAPPQIAPIPTGTRCPSRRSYIVGVSAAMALSGYDLFISAFISSIGARHCDRAPRRVHERTAIVIPAPGVAFRDQVVILARVSILQCKVVSILMSCMPRIELFRLSLVQKRSCSCYGHRWLDIVKIRQFSATPALPNFEPFRD